MVPSIEIWNVPAENALRHVDEDAQVRAVRRYQRVQREEQNDSERDCPANMEKSVELGEPLRSWRKDPAKEAGRYPLHNLNVTLPSPNTNRAPLAAIPALPAYSLSASMILGSTSLPFTSAAMSRSSRR